MATIAAASRDAPRKRGESSTSDAARPRPSGDVKTDHTERARTCLDSTRGVGSQLRSNSGAGGAASSTSVWERTVSSAATTCSQIPLPPQPHVARSASGPVPVPHSTITSYDPRGSRTVASIFVSSTARSVTRFASTSASATRTRSRANHEATVAGRRERHVANGVM